jgi:hypothetical protein
MEGADLHAAVQSQNWRTAIMPKRLRYKGFSIAVPDNWSDITESLEKEDVPLTIADGTVGVGALQISSAFYRSGAEPRITSDDLSSMLDEFGEARGLNWMQRWTERHGPVLQVGGEAARDDDYVAIWYLSNGKDVLFVTYTCEWERRLEEFKAYTAAVRSVEFSGPSPDLG